MRRSISLVLVAVMLLSMVVFAIPSASAAAAEKPKLDWGNAYTTAYRFDGEVRYHEVTGNDALTATASKDSEVITTWGDEANGVIEMDGKIDEGEWGKPAISISSEYATKFSGKNGQKNPDYDTPSKENTFFYTNFKRDQLNINYFPLQFDAYFLWDDEYLYMAIDVLDWDGHVNATKSDRQEGAWNGDAVQFRIDPDGPNSIVDGEGYDGKVNPYPWKRSEHPGWEETYSEFPNFIVSLTEIQGKGAFVERWDAARRYNVVEVPPTESGGEVTYTGSQSNVADGTDIWGPVYASVTTEVQNDLIDYVNGIYYPAKTQYEIAIPWEYMDSAQEILESGNYFEPEAGMELGFALALMNGQRGAVGDFDSYLEWGNGVTRDATYHHYEVAGGSNCLVLDGTSYKEADICTHETFEDPTCDTGYKCTNCGYEKGHSLGHVFAYSDASTATADARGGITGTCTREGCGYVVKKFIPETTYETVASFTEDMKAFPDAFITAEDEASKAGWDRQWVYSDGTPYKDSDGKTRNSFEILDGKAVANLTQLNFTGTAFWTDSVSDMLSWSYSMDVNLQGYSFPTENGDADENANNMYGENGYTSGIYCTFGGNEKNGYNAGLFYIPDEEQYYFAIIRGNRTENTKIHSTEELEKRALAYNKVDKADAEKFLKEWHNFKVVYDDTTQTAFVFWDDELMTYAFTDLRKHDRGSTDASPVMRTFDVQFYAKNIVVERLKPGDPIPDEDNKPVDPSGKYTATIDGVATEYAAGDQVTLKAEAFYVKGNLGYRFANWSGDVDAIADTTKSEVTFTMPAKNIAITSAYTLVGDTNNDGVLSATDALLVARMVVGNMPMSSAGDINGDGVLTSADVVFMKRYLVGNYLPEK